MSMLMNQTFANLTKSQMHKGFVKRERIKPTMGLNGGFWPDQQ